MEPTQESKSSIKVTLNSKGEAQIECKVYESEESYIPPPIIVGGDPSQEQPSGRTEKLTAEDIPEVIAARVMHTIHSLERQRIKVVGRELPEVEQQGDST
ncbi:hypothetical protein LCGC14_2906730 [marine sediment metagenome]|uniref:Uncharacterized protein n=1 Tax=marine sediment metagenome TaxID=412755 RepID=A0A0F8XT91_9ZZZZ